MGPRSGERGNKRVSSKDALRSNRLQWGHVQVNVETLRGRARADNGGGGLQWGHVQVNVETNATAAAVQAALASMGPRSGERGNSGRQPALCRE